MGNDQKQEARESTDRTARESWAAQVGSLGEEMARVPLLAVQLGTSLSRQLVEALDEFVGALSARRAPPQERPRRERGHDAAQE